MAEDSDSNEEESEHEINPEAGESAESEGDLSSEVEEEGTTTTTMMMRKKKKRNQS